MTRRPFIVVCPKTGRADVRTHADENTGAYFLWWLRDSQTSWVRYSENSHRGRYEWESEIIAKHNLSLAPPVPADAVWGPGTEVQDEPTPTTSGAYSDGYRAGLAQSAAIIARAVAEVVSKEQP